VPVWCCVCLVCLVIYFYLSHLQIYTVLLGLSTKKVPLDAIAGDKCSKINYILCQVLKVSQLLESVERDGVISMAVDI